MKIVDLPWNHRYLELARQISLWSKDPSSQLGAICIGGNGQILSQGYNGFPRGVSDLEERLNEREVKYDFMVHAEMNCIYNSCLNGVSLKNSVLYVFGLPVCHKCTPGIIQVGITEIHMAYDKSGAINRWSDSWNKSKIMFDEAGIEYYGYEFNGSSRNWFDDVRLSICSRHQ